MSSLSAASTVGPPPGMRVRLSSNESNFGPSPAAVAAAAKAVGEMNLYPDDQSIDLRDALAAAMGRTRGEVSVGNGSAAVLMDVVGHECREGGSVLAFARSFIVYRLAARNAGATYVEVPTAGPAQGASSGYARDPERLLDTIDDTTRVVVIDNPGNPTGAHLTGEQLRTLVGGIPEHVTIVLDEAYTQFAAGQAGYAAADELGLDHPRLLVTRTFSKAYALAGLRVGYVLGAEELIAPIDAWRARFNLTAASQAAALAALADDEHLARTVAGTLAGRERMVTGLRALGVPLTTGLGNFLTVELGMPSEPIVAAYAARGIGVRPLLPYGMDEQIRVSVGTPSEVDELLTVSEDVLRDVPSRR